MKRLIVVLASTLFFGLGLALAQTTTEPLDRLVDQWASERQVFVTKAAKEHLKRLAAEELTTSGSTKGLSKQAKLLLSDEVRSSGSLVFASSERRGKQVLTRAGKVDLSDDQFNFVIAWFSPSTVGVSLERFPTIHLIVQPVPPRDYKVAINGEDCPATEKGIYKVPVGAVNVSVVRTGQLPCAWNGDVSQGQTQDVNCVFR